MKILYVTTPGPSSQGDFQENMILHGLREIISTGVVDYPRKKIMYNDFSETVREEIHGRGFTLYTVPLLDLNREQRKMSHLDVILYGVTDAYGVTDFPNINQLCKNIWYVDGHDTSDIKKTPCFKRELFEEQKNVYPTGFGIPDYQIRAIDLDNKDQKFQTTAPAEAFFKPEVMRHLVNYYTYTCEQDKEYYQGDNHSQERQRHHEPHRHVLIRGCAVRQESHAPAFVTASTILRIATTPPAPVKPLTVCTPSLLAVFSLPFGGTSASTITDSRST